MIGRAQSLVVLKMIRKDVKPGHIGNSCGVVLIQRVGDQDVIKCARRMPEICAMGRRTRRPVLRRSQAICIKQPPAEIPCAVIWVFDPFALSSPDIHDPVALRDQPECW